jgi:predicted PurR-regulated permease PerM
LWAVLMAVLSLLPAVGSALVWLPVALYLVSTGAVWQGVVLVAYGVLVIGLVDNFLRPILVGQDARMPTTWCWCPRWGASRCSASTASWSAP